MSYFCFLSRLVSIRGRIAILSRRQGSTCLGEHDGRCHIRLRVRREDATHHRFGECSRRQHIGVTRYQIRARRQIQATIANTYSVRSQSTHRAIPSIHTFGQFRYHGIHTIHGPRTENRRGAIALNLEDTGVHHILLAIEIRPGARAQCGQQFAIRTIIREEASVRKTCRSARVPGIGYHCTRCHYLYREMLIYSRISASTVPSSTASTSAAMSPSVSSSTFVRSSAFSMVTVLVI